MKDVAGHGRTILFVSHNMGMIQSLCNRGVLFSQGRLMMEGETDRVVDVYLNELNNMADIELAERQDRLGNGLVRLVKAQAFSANGSPTLMTSRPARFEFEVNQHIPDMDFCFTIYNYHGHGLAHFHTANISNKISLGKKIICHVESLMLMPGTYRLNAGVLLHGDFLDNIASVLIFDVEPDPTAGRSHLVNTGKWDIFLPHAWEVSGQ
jgi:lipopolysaccharide transport system ATP-binding protein